MAKQKFTYVHGQALPERIKHHEGKASVTISFILRGAIPAKKNNQAPIIFWQEADKYVRKVLAERPFTIDDWNKIKSPGNRLVRPVIVPNARHQRWFTKAAETIITQRAKNLAVIASKGLVYPLSDCSVSIYTYKANRARRDHGNREGSISDLLVNCHIVSDDNDDVYNPLVQEAARYVGKIRDHATTIFITAYYDKVQQGANEPEMNPNEPLSAPKDNLV